MFKIKFTIAPRLKAIHTFLPTFIDLRVIVRTNCILHLYTNTDQFHNL